MQIVILDAYSVNPGDLDWDGLKQLGSLSAYDRTHPDMVAQRLMGADAVFVNKVHIGEEELAKANRLKFIGVLATGYDIVDIKAAQRHGITVCNIPAYSTESVAQMTIALLLEICNNVGHHSREVHRGRWTNSPDFCFWDTPLIELNGLTFGIIGCGRTGSATARIASSFGMKVIGYSRTKHDGFVGKQVDSVDELLREADIVSLHCPSTEETRGMVNATFISKMKDGAILLNTARGNLLEEIDVADALNDGKLYALGMDVASREPISRSNPLLTADNCIITPHIAWAPLAARRRLVNIATENLKAFIDGKPINVVS